MKRSSQRWILLIVWLSVSFKYKGEVLCHLHKLIAGKTRCKIHTEESNKLTAKNVKRIDFELHQLFTIWILSRNGAMSDILWTWHLLSVTVIQCEDDGLGKIQGEFGSREWGVMFISTGVAIARWYFHYC